MSRAYKYAAAENTPDEVGQMSPDGMWVWNGSRWIPGQRAVQPPPRRPRTSSTIVAAVGIAATLAILISVVYTSGAYKLIRLPVRQQAINCLPSDFPTYGGMTIVQAGYEYGRPAPGDTTSCNMTFVSRAGYADVRDFYRRSLNTGGWTTTAVLGGIDSMDIHLVRDERAQSYGYVSVTKAVTTEVRVSLFD